MFPQITSFSYDVLLSLPHMYLDAHTQCVHSAHTVKRVELPFFFLRILELNEDKKGYVWYARGFFILSVISLCTY